MPVNVSPVRYLWRDGSLEMTGVFLAVDGSGGSPGIAFYNAPTVGLSLDNGDSIGLEVGGGTRVRINPDGDMLPHGSTSWLGDNGAAERGIGKPWARVYGGTFHAAGNGNEETPAFTWDGGGVGGGSGHGMFRDSSIDDDLAFTSQGSAMLRLSNGSGYVGPFYDNTWDLGSSSERWGTVHAIIHRAGNGSAANAAYGFTSAVTTGMYLNGSSLGLLAGGTNVVNVTTGGQVNPGATNVYTLGNSATVWNVVYSTFVAGGSGTNTGPTFTRNGDTNTGVYFPADDTVGITTNSTLRLSVATDVITSTLPLEFAEADLGTPTEGSTRIGVPSTDGRPPLLSKIDSYFGERFIEHAWHDSQKTFVVPSGSASLAVLGMTLGTSGSVAFSTPTSTNWMTSCLKQSFTTGAVSGNTSDVHGTSPVAYRGSAADRGGFLFHARFAVGTNYTANTRLFVGMINSAVTLTGTTNPGSLSSNSLAGVGLNSGSATLNIYMNDAGGTPSTVSTGLTVSASDAFDVWLWMEPGNTVLNYHIHRRNGAAGTVSGTTATFPPAANVMLYPHAWIATGEAVAKTMYLMRMFIETWQ